MNQKITQAIVLKRVNYGESDRILTLLTKDHGKVAAMARGVRKERSKLAGGVELFSVSEVGLLQGRGDVSTLTTSRLIQHFNKIVADIDKTMLGYQILKLTDKVIEDDAETEYFTLLKTCLTALNDTNTPDSLIQLWYNLQLLSISGHAPNLMTDSIGSPLEAGQAYSFDTINMVFEQHGNGIYQTDHIKILRLANQAKSPTKLIGVVGLEQYCPALNHLSEQMRGYHMRV